MVATSTTFRQDIRSSPPTAEADAAGKAEPTFEAVITDESGETVAVVEKR